MMRCLALRARGELAAGVCAPVLGRIAVVMAFLERIGVVHRDLTARNVLVGGTATDVKLSDVGAARSVLQAEGAEYVASEDHEPFWWMAPEALREARFSHKTAVWAFGILCWEVTSLEKTPFGACGPREVA